MRTLKYLFISTLAIFIIACESGIDPITPVNPGPDKTDPVIQIQYPLEGTLIRVREDVTPIKIQVDATDDIELASVAISLDGTEIATFSDFKDYRHAIISHNYATLTNGKHTLSVSAKDLSGKVSTQSVKFEKVEPYTPKFDGEIFYVPFDGDYLDLVSINEATKVGNPSFANGKFQKAYLGAADAYLTFPTKDKSKGLNLLGAEFSAAFWYKLNSSPNRAGILVIGPVDTENPTKMNNRNHGFRFFREGSSSKQTFKLNAGNGTSDAWFDGGDNASLTNNGEWVHIAFTISKTKCTIYFNGKVVSDGVFTGISWAGCDLLSIGSGAPRFTGWDHLSDQSLIDELRIFNKALTQNEVQAMIAN
ncbi:MAG: LamG-like jellyroll fold domain-containing protein [Petrimonas sp.]|nr:LamG-like jellyroll fold domain-containing protein [Petrimonas sp.]